MALDTATTFSQVIQEHLELKRRNSTLEQKMPIDKYKSDDPFENHPLFKTEEQARIQDTMDGVQGIEAEVTSLDWPTHDDFERTVEAARTVDQPTEPHETVSPDEVSDETLWSRSRDFDWGD